MRISDWSSDVCSSDLKRRSHPAVRIALLVIGTLLILSTPIVGPLPGPGGIFVFAGGLTLVLRNSRWARRRFARLKRRWPKMGEVRSEEHTSELQSLMRISYAVFCLKKKKQLEEIAGT